MDYLIFRWLTRALTRLLPIKDDAENLKNHQLIARQKLKLKLYIIATVIFYKIIVKLTKRLLQSKQVVRKTSGVA